MRMHRGSSKDDRPRGRSSESLPLSASPPPVRLVLEVSRAAEVERHELLVPAGSPVRAALRRIGRSPEGCAVLRDGASVPLDLRIDEPMTLVVVPTFSGG